MTFKTHIIYDFGFPENPVGLLKSLEPKGRVSQKARRMRLVAAEMVLRDANLAVHPRAWREFVAHTSLPAWLVKHSPPVPKGWAVPVFLERAGCGGVVHVLFEVGGLTHPGHRLDISGPMEVFLGFCSETGEKAFPDFHRFPFVARVRPGVRLKGRSWELPCLIGYFAVHSGVPTEPIFATGWLEGVSLRSGEMLEDKLEGWLREVGQGTQAVILRDQERIFSRFKGRFGAVRIVDDLADLLSFFREKGWLEPHAKTPNRLGCERLLRASEECYRSGKPKLALITMEALKRNRNVLSSRQEAVWLGGMHYLLSCFGRFDEGINYLKEFMEKLKLEPQILTDEEKVIYAAKAAVQLYDAHRFNEAEELLDCLMRDKYFIERVSPISRAKLLGTMGQVLTARGELKKAEKILEEAVKIFEEHDPLEVSRAYHYLIHNRLRAKDVQKAKWLLDMAKQWLEETDIYGALFRCFYETELSRLLGYPCERPHLKATYSGLVHPYCFALQAWARNPAHPLAERQKAMEEAANRMEKDGKAGGVLQFLALAYRLYEAYLSGDREWTRKSWEQWAQWVKTKGGRYFEIRYRDFLAGEPQDQRALESLMEVIPYH